MPRLLYVTRGFGFCSLFQKNALFSRLVVVRQASSNLDPYGIIRFELELYIFCFITINEENVHNPGYQIFYKILQILLRYVKSETISINSNLWRFIG